MHRPATVRPSIATASRTRLLIPAILVLVAGVVAACTEPVAQRTIASLKIVPQQDSFFNGSTTAANPFAVTLFDNNSVEIRDGRPITYSSSAPDVFTVDSKTGAVTGVSVGSGFYRATVTGRVIEASVKIIAPVAQIQLTTGDFALNVGGTRQLTPNLLSGNGATISGRTVNYSSSNTSVASVSTGGLVTAITIGTLTRKIHRHPACSTSRPPTRGPSAGPAGPPAGTGPPPPATPAAAPQDATAANVGEPAATGAASATPPKRTKGGKKGGKAPKAEKAAKPPQAPKAPKAPKEKKPKRVSALDAAAQVIAKSDKPMRAVDMIAQMEAKGLWTSPGGKTPGATLYAAIIREIAAKGKEARFAKHDRGLFIAPPSGKGA